MNPTASLKSETQVKAEKREQHDKCKYCKKILPDRWNEQKRTLHIEICRKKTPEERMQKKSKGPIQKLKKEPEREWKVEQQLHQEEKKVELDTIELPPLAKKPDPFTQFSQGHFLNQTPIVRHISSEPLFSGAHPGDNLQTDAHSNQLYTQPTQNISSAPGNFIESTGQQFLKKFACHLQKRCPFCGNDITLAERSYMRNHFVKCEIREKAMQNESRRQSAISSLQPEDKLSNLGHRRAILKDSSSSVGIKRARKP